MPANQEDHARSKRGFGLPTLVGGALWLALALLIRWHASPRLGHVGGGNSDDAIPQLMANARAWIPYDIYYWGQDRFGAWPFLLARGIGHLVGHGWTPDRLHWLLGALILSAVWPLRKLGGRYGNVLAAALLLALVFDRRGEPSSAPGAIVDLTPHSWHPAVLHTAQPYGWMLAPLVWSWWVMRVAFEARREGDRRSTLALFATGAVAALLAAWLTELSLLMLLVIGLVEVFSAGPLTSGALLRRGTFLFCTLLFALIGEAALHAWYVGWSGEHGLWFQPFAGARLDTGYVAEDIAHAWTTFRGYSDWWALPLALLVTLVLIGRSLRTRSASPIDRVVIGLTLVALANAVVVGVVMWPRLNHYAPRYFALTDLFAVTAAGAGVFALLPIKLRDQRWTPAVACAVIGLAAFVELPANAVSSRAPALRQICAELAKRAPGAALLGSYWGTYPFIDGSVPDPLVPVIEEMEMVRNPWTVSLLRTADPVVVSHSYDNRYGPAEDPVPFIQEYGALLEVKQPEWLKVGGRPFTLYRNRTAEVLPGTHATTIAGSIDAPCQTNPCLPLAPIKGGVEAVRIDMQARFSGTVALFFGSTSDPQRPLPRFTVEPLTSPLVTAAAGTGAPTLLQTPHPNVVVIRFSGQMLSGLRLTYAADDPRPAPSLRAVVVLP
jgi:hypothetical protein